MAKSTSKSKGHRSVVRKTAAKKTAVKKASTHRPATRKPAAKKAVSHKTAMKKPAAKKPAAKKPISKRPAPRKPPASPAAPVPASARAPFAAPAQQAAPAAPAFVGIKSHPLAPATQVEKLDSKAHATLDEILARNGRSESNLLSILQDIQAANNWLPRPWLEALSADLTIPRSRVYRLATFFKSLSLKPRGEHICQVCIGTTCHVRGAPRLVDKVELELAIKPGETTADMKFTLETVGCVGACALGPLVVLDGTYHSNMTADAFGKVIRGARGAGAKAAAQPEE